MRAGQWKAPTRFLPCGRSIAVLPPIAASTCATRLVGDGHPGDAAQIGRRGEAGRVGRAAAAERDDRAAAVEAQVVPEAVDRRERLRLLAERQLVRLREPRAERELRVHAVDAGDVRIADERRRGRRPGRARRAALSAPRSHEHAGGCEDDVVGVVRDGVGNLLVERLSLLPQCREPVSILRERAIGVADSLPRVVDGDGHEHRRRALAERPARALGERPRRRRARARAARRARARSHDDLLLDARESCGSPARGRARRRVEPVRRSISSSRSRNGRPMRSATSAASVDLPAPMKPTSATCRCSGQPLPSRCQTDP